jgi:hypothetical protein
VMRLAEDGKWGAPGVQHRAAAGSRGIIALPELIEGLVPGSMLRGELHAMSYSSCVLFVRDRFAFWLQSWQRQLSIRNNAGMGSNHFKRYETRTGYRPFLETSASSRVENIRR